MSLHRSSTLLCVVLAVVLFAAPQAARCAPVTGRAVSLKAVQSLLKSGGSKQVSNLCGITRLTGYVVDKASKDLVLIGEVDPDMPPLHLDDLVVAMRNAWYLYARVEGRTRYYSPPGCSIDPDPRVLQELNELGAQGCGGDGLQSYIERWNQIGRRPQSVRVLGIPFDTRFARVMVDADYYMKRLVNGSVALGIEGFDSLSDMSIKLAREEIITGKPCPIPLRSLNRFWFHPAEATYEEDDGAVVLASCRVALLTEEELLNEGKVSGLGKPSPLAAKFAKGFTDHYDAIAAARPIYAELESLFRASAIARLMHDSNAPAAAGASLGYLLNSYRVTKAPVSRKVQGLTHVREINERKEDHNGVTTISVVLPCCGGVSMDIRPKRVNARRTASAASGAGPAGAKTSVPRSPRAPTVTTGVRRTVLSSRKSPSALTWDFPVKGTR